MFNWLYSPILRRIELKKAKERESFRRFYCFFNGLPYPELVESPPCYKSEVDAYIREHAKRDLPAAQFEGRINQNSPPKDKVEMNGVLGFNGTLFEIAYQPPNIADLEDFLQSNETSAWSATSEMRIPFDKSSKARELIHFHNHPDRDNEFGRGDLCNIKNMLDTFTGKRSFFVLYTPPDDRITWYECSHP